MIWEIQREKLEEMACKLLTNIRKEATECGGAAITCR